MFTISFKYGNDANERSSMIFLRIVPLFTQSIACSAFSFLLAFASLCSYAMTSMRMFGDQSSPQTEYSPWATVNKKLRKAHAEKQQDYLNILATVGVRWRYSKYATDLNLHDAVVVLALHRLHGSSLGSANFFQKRKSIAFKKLFQVLLRICPIWALTHQFFHDSPNSKKGKMVCEFT